MMCRLLFATLLWVTIPAAAEECGIVLWNSDAMFDTSTVTARAGDLRAFRKHFHDVDLVLLTEVTSLKVVNAIRDRLGLVGYHTVCSNFAPDDFDDYNSFEVGVISRFPLANSVEYDPTPDYTGLPEEPIERRLPIDPEARVSGLKSVEGLRGFLAVDVPALEITVVLTHLKSSRGATGKEDHDNARLREFVAIGMARFVADRLRQAPDSTILVAGDMNVGETDRAKVGVRLDADHYDWRSGDLYDDTHAILSAGLIDGLRMASLTKALGQETYDAARFQGAGPIDCLYVVGRLAGQFRAATRSPATFGSDHFAVSTRFLAQGDLPPPTPASPSSVDQMAVTADAVAVVRIMALLPNPPGQDAGKEWVKLKNTTDQPINLAGWRLRDKAGNLVPLDGNIGPGREVTIHLAEDQMPLNNSGDTIELLDPENSPIHRIRYSARQASPGTVIDFDP